MQQESCAAIIADQTERALWEVQNVISCVGDDLWDKAYCQMPLWKHIYHMLHSLDQWMVNPRDEDFREPPFHRPALNNLDVFSDGSLTRNQINSYFAQVEDKITRYMAGLNDEELLKHPPQCEYTRFTLILAQFRHLHTHMGMVMGFIVAETGLWPQVVGLEGDIPEGEYGTFA